MGKENEGVALLKSLEFLHSIDGEEAMFRSGILVLDHTTGIEEPFSRHKDHGVGKVIDRLGCLIDLLLHLTAFLRFELSNLLFKPKIDKSKKDTEDDNARGDDDGHEKSRVSKLTLVGGLGVGWRRLKNRTGRTVTTAAVGSGRTEAVVYGFAVIKGLSHSIESGGTLRAGRTGDPVIRFSREEYTGIHLVRIGTALANALGGSSIAAANRIT